MLLGSLPNTPVKVFIVNWEAAPFIQWWDAILYFLNLYLNQDAKWSNYIVTFLYCSDLISRRHFIFVNILKR